MFLMHGFFQTINDVILGVTQAGLSRYLNKRYGEVSLYSLFTLIYFAPNNYVLSFFHFHFTFYSSFALD